MWNKKFREISFDEAIAQSSGETIKLSERAPGEITEQRLIESPINHYVFLGAIFGLILFALIALGRVIDIGLLKSSFYSARAATNIHREVLTPAPRGIITDRTGVPLVTNELTFSAFVKVSDMVKNNERDKVLAAVSDILDVDSKIFLEKLAEADLEKMDDIKIAEDVSREETIKLNSLGLESISIREDYKRHYGDMAFSHVIGYVGLPRKEDLQQNKKLSLVDAIGRTGLESYYNDYLQGVNGEETIYKNAKGEAQDTESIQPPVPGNDLNTTIDAGLQKYFYDRLVYNTNLRGQTSGVGIALNPKTGEILSLISLPSFDANNIKKYLNMKSEPFFNRAIAGIYNPGSTIKPLHAVAGLHEGVISTTLKIFTRGFIEILNPYDPSAPPSKFIDHYCCGWLDVYSAIAASSNVYFYADGGGLPPNEADIIKGASGISGIGIKKLNEYWKKFGLADKTGIDLGGEGKSILPSPEEEKKRTGDIWRVGDTYNVSIGQGDLAINMMQLADYIAGVANKGKIYKPHLMQKDAEVLLDLSEFSPEFKEVEKGMMDSVYKPYGTSKTLADVPFKIAVKTGSAQTNFNTKTNALAVAYGPTDAPGGGDIEVLVLIENAKEGSLNALPIAREVLTWYYENRILEVRQ